MGNTKKELPIYRVDIDKLIDGYLKLKDALEKIAEPDPRIPVQMQAINARRIAKEALGI